MTIDHTKLRPIAERTRDARPDWFEFREFRDSPFTPQEAEFIAEVTPGVVIALLDENARLESLLTCHDCDGRGMQTFDRCYGNQHYQDEETCSTCKGGGRSLDDEVVEYIAKLTAERDAARTELASWTKQSLDYAGTANTELKAVREELEHLKRAKTLTPEAQGRRDAMVASYADKICTDLRAERDTFKSERDAALNALHQLRNNVDGHDATFAKWHESAGIDPRNGAYRGLTWRDERAKENGRG